MAFRWRRGFLRVWVIFAALFAVAVFAVNAPAYFNPPRPYFSEAAFIFSDDSMEFERTNTYGQQYTEAVAGLSAGTMIGGRFEEFDNRIYMLTPVANDGLTEDRQVAIVKATMRKELAEKTEATKAGALSNIVWFSTVPALALLIAGAAIAWIIAGFRGSHP